MLRWIVVLLTAQLLAASTAQGSPEEESRGPRRPRVGLALSGGGARGCAHIGVLRVLEELRIPVDYIAGTSMGAIVGGLYATGLSADEIEALFAAMDWAAIGDDELPRRDRVFRRKEDDQRYLMNLEIGLRGFVLPRGLRNGQRFSFELRRWSWPVVGVEDFSQLPIPFTAVAADLETGERVLLDHGSLPLALRASMSIPGVFTPVELDGRLLVDGGIVNNLPTGVVREMGAEIVLAVDIGDQLLDREQLRSMLAVTGQAMAISSNETMKEQRLRADLLLTPEVAGRSTLDFADVTGLISEGAEEARRHLDRLAELALSEEEYLRHLAARHLPEHEPRPITSVRFEGLERVDPRVARKAMRTPIGEPLDLELLRQDLGRIYGLGDFETVDFEVAPHGEELELVVVVQERRGGPFFLRNAFQLELDDDQHSATTFLVNLTGKRLNTLGAEWSTDVQLGSGQELSTAFYQPLDFSGRWFLEATLYERRDLSQIVAANGAIAELERLDAGFRLDAGYAIGRFGEIRLGAFRERRELSSKGVGLADLPTVELGGWGGRFAVDRLDSIYFPRTGQLGLVSIQAIRPSFGADDRFTIAGLQHVGAVSRGRHTVLSWVELGTALGVDQPPYAWFGGGGFFSFSGYRRGELFGGTYAIVRPTYFYRLGSLPSFLGEGFYLGGWLEAGNFWSSRDDAALDDLRYAATLTVGAETVIGPLYLAFGFAEEGRQQVVISIGPSFSTGPR